MGHGLYLEPWRAHCLADTHGRPGDNRSTPVRIKDIADDLGISVAAVSRALRNRGETSPETRALVLKRAAELNYRPNLVARALVTGRSGLVGLIVPDLVHSFFAELALGVSGALRKSGVNLVVASSEEDPDLEREEIERLLARGVDALLIASTHPTGAVIAELTDRNVPCVLLDRQFPDLAASFVGVDDVKVGVMATEHLIKAGCTRIGHIRGTGVSTARERYEGYIEALARRRIPVREEHIVPVVNLDRGSHDAGYEATKVILRQNPLPDGIFCCNDPTAIGAMQAILDAGLRIPEDIALIGCGNLHYCQALKVPLSSIDQQTKSLGSHAARMALQLTEDGPKTPRKVLLEPAVVARRSTQRGMVDELDAPRGAWLNSQAS